MARMTGFEPVTTKLTVLRSTIELHPNNIKWLQDNRFALLYHFGYEPSPDLNQPPAYKEIIYHKKNKMQVKL